MRLKYVAGALLSFFIGVGAASAATYPTFVLDTANSDIDITVSQSCINVFGRSHCSKANLTAEFAEGADNFSWTPTAENDMIYEGDFIDWEVSGFGIAEFDVEVTLAFSSPDPASGSASGGGDFGTLFGFFSGGILTWDGPATIAFAQGSVLDVYFEGVKALGFGNDATTGAKIVGDPIAPVPLPASGLLLLAGVAGIGALRRRKSKS